MTLSEETIEGEERDDGIPVGDNWMCYPISKPLMKTKERIIKQRSLSERNKWTILPLDGPLEEEECNPLEMPLSYQEKAIDYFERFMLHKFDMRPSEVKEVRGEVMKYIPLCLKTIRRQNEGNGPKKEQHESGCSDSSDLAGVSTGQNKILVVMEALTLGIEVELDCYYYSMRDGNLYMRSKEEGITFPAGNIQTFNHLSLQIMSKTNEDIAKLLIEISKRKEE